MTKVIKRVLFSVFLLGALFVLFDQFFALPVSASHGGGVLAPIAGRVYDRKTGRPFVNYPIYICYDPIGTTRAYTNSDGYWQSHADNNVGYHSNNRFQYCVRINGGNPPGYQNAVAENRRINNYWEQQSELSRYERQRSGYDCGGGGWVNPPCDNTVANQDEKWHDIPTDHNLDISFEPIPPDVSVTPVCSGNDKRGSVTISGVGADISQGWYIDFNSTGNFSSGGSWFWKSVGSGTTTATIPDNSSTGWNSFQTGETWYVRVYSVAKQSHSSVTSFVAGNCSSPPPPPPSGPTVSAYPKCVGSESRADVYWSGGNGSNGWYIDFGTDPYWGPGHPNKYVSSGTYTELPTSSSYGSNSFTNPGATYYVRVYDVATGTHSPNTQFTAPDCAPPPPPPPPPPPQPIISCTSISPTEWEEGRPINLSLGFYNSSYDGYLNGASMQFSVNGSSYSHSQSGVGIIPNPVPPSSGAAGYPSQFTIGASGQYTVSYTIYGGNTPGGSINCSGGLTIVRKPFFTVLGGDISAGMPASCSGWTPPAGSPGGIYGFAEPGVPGVGKGAGGQLSAFAARTINGYNSANTRPGPAFPTAPKGLGFANNTGDPTYGGNFGTGFCPHNYFSFPSSTQVFNGGSMTGLNGVYRTTGSGPLTIDVSTISNKVEIYTDREVRIHGSSISYAPGSWGMNTIPQLRIVTTSNIHFFNNVTNVSGIYVAGGYISTCSSGLGSANATQIGSGFCNSPMTIYGSFIAPHVKLLRTNGTLFTNVPAEVFRFTPEAWLANPASTPPAGAIKYDAITNLSPIL